MRGRNSMEGQNDLRRAVVRLQSITMGLVIGALGGILLFAATIILVLKGGSVVGPHLSLLAQFLPGYRVTFVGSFLGFVYGFAIGFGVGFAVGRIYNFVVDLNESRLA